MIITHSIVPAMALSETLVINNVITNVGLTEICLLIIVFDFAVIWMDCGMGMSWINKYSGWKGKKNLNESFFKTGMLIFVPIFFRFTADQTVVYIKICMVRSHELIGTITSHKIANDLINENYSQLD